MLSSVDCDSGTSAAPNTPCRKRKITISPMLPAMPHSMEVTVKPTRLTSSTFFAPKRALSQPTGAVMMAAATT